MGGANRVAIFGYLGLRLNDDHLVIDPSLPPQIPAIRFRNFYWQGHGIEAVSNQTHTTLRRLPITYTLPTANEKYGLNNSIPVLLEPGQRFFNLNHEGALVVPNRQIGRNRTVKGNILQCKSSITSSHPFMAGQFPLAAIDGAASTKWEAYAKNETAYLTVDLGPSTAFYPIKFLLFDWAAAPPKGFEVWFSNDTSSLQNKALLRKVYEDRNVSISRPWDPSRVAKIEAYKGNATNVTLEEPIWSGRFAHLGVSGNQARMGRKNCTWAAAQVAEWSVITEAELDDDMLYDGGPRTFGEGYGNPRSIGEEGNISTCDEGFGIMLAVNGRPWLE